VGKRLLFDPYIDKLRVAPPAALGRINWLEVPVAFERRWERGVTVSLAWASEGKEDVDDWEQVGETM
jgi:hypothetical protein